MDTTLAVLQGLGFTILFLGGAIMIAMLCLYVMVGLAIFWQEGWSSAWRFWRRGSL